MESIERPATSVRSWPILVKAPLAARSLRTLLRLPDCAWLFLLALLCLGPVSAGCGPTPADDDATVGDDDTASGDDDATSGDDDATSGDDDATSGDDDATSGDDDATSGDDDATSGDDDATSSTDSDHDGQSLEAGDCDDHDATVYTGAPETCDARDNDCDGQIDEDALITAYRDADLDGHGDLSAPAQLCVIPPGYVTLADDCDDSSASIYPGASEVCNSRDDDCDAQIDEGVLSLFYLDADGDGYGLSASTTTACSAPAGFAAKSGDCDDAAAAVYPGAPELCDALDNDCDGQIDESLTPSTWYPDSDADGYGASSPTLQACTKPSGYSAQAGDCDDANAAIHPGVLEVCDGRDDNCDGQVDEGVNKTFYLDADGDGYGASSSTTRACTQPPGYVAISGDCNDASASIHPGGLETCNLTDDDCDGQTDEGLSTTTFFPDTDKDGYGAGTGATQACMKPAGYSTVSGDCNDANATVYPGATEACDTLDNNCNGQIDEGVTSSYFKDADGDGYGANNAVVQACTKPTGYSAKGGDCNDANTSINPGATETCNAIDDNCNGQLDEGVPTVTYYPDADKDGYGPTASALVACAKPSGYVALGGDCNDSDPAISPAALEACDSIDNDCDGQIDEGVTPTWYKDSDRDGYGAAASPIQACTKPSGYVADPGSPDRFDCNDNNLTVNPGATEICDGLDNNCNAIIDEGLTAISYYPDADGDGYGARNYILQACARPPGYLATDGDCDDEAAGVHPTAPEVCNFRDDDCDGLIDEGVLPYELYPDSDGDGFGRPDTSDPDGRLLSCGAVTGYVTARGDCDDTNPIFHPGADDPAGDGLDQDCGGSEGPEPHVGLSSSSLASIQVALNAAAAGATVWVGPGTYAEYNLSFGGRAVALKATHRARATTLDAASKGRVFNFTTEGSGTLISGFTIRGGYVKGANGGAMLLSGASPVFRDCTFTANQAVANCTFSSSTCVGGDGGAVYITNGAPTFPGSTFSSNTASASCTYNASTRATGCGGGRGGALFLDTGATGTLDDVVINANTAASSCAYDYTTKVNDFCDGGRGGGIYVAGTSPTLSGVQLSTNSAGLGGGVYVAGGSPTLVNVLFYGNSAVQMGAVPGSPKEPYGGYGGGLFTAGAATALYNCAVRSNGGPFGSGVWIESGQPSLTGCLIALNGWDGLSVAGASTKVTLKSSILAYNSSLNLNNVSATVQLTACDLYSPVAKNHNLTSFPAGNYTLEPDFLDYGSMGAPRDFHLALSSILIDAGDASSLDLDGTALDPGIYGGSEGDGWDLDRDGVPDWFWPGELIDAPAGFAAMNYDTDDQDPGVR